MNKPTEVRFDLFCNKCKHAKKDGTEDPCNKCLDYPVRLGTMKPKNYKEAEK